MVLCLAATGSGAFRVRAGCLFSISDEESDSEVELATCKLVDAESAPRDVLEDHLIFGLGFVAGVAGDRVVGWLRIAVVSLDTATDRCLDNRFLIESLVAVTVLILLAASQAVQ